MRIYVFLPIACRRSDAVRRLDAGRRLQPTINLRFIHIKLT